MSLMFKAHCRSLFAASLSWLTFVVNPAYLSGCLASEDPDASSKNDAEIEAALLTALDQVNETGEWTFEGSDGSYVVSLMLMQQVGADMKTARLAPSFMSRAYACGTKSFYQSASACITKYQLAIEGSMSLANADSGEPIVTDIRVTGALEQYGGPNGSAELQFGDDPGNYLVLEKQGSQYSVASFMGTALGASAIDVSSR